MADHLPVQHPGHNLVEVCKELLLLYKHLKHPDRRCVDCIGKHFLQILAYLDELPSLDLHQEYQDHIDLLRPRCQNLLEAWGNGVDPDQIAEELRGMRKAIQPAAIGLLAHMGHHQQLQEHGSPQQQMCPSCQGAGCSICGEVGMLAGGMNVQPCQCGGRGCSLCARGCA
jgi:hypothetical protein